MSEAGRRVRVCDDAVFMVFARRAEGQAAGRLFFGSFLWSEQRNEQIKVLKDYSVPLLCVPKEGVPPRKGTPGVSRFRLSAELPSRNVCSRGRQELASLKQLASLYPRPNVPLGTIRWGYPRSSVLLFRMFRLFGGTCFRASARYSHSVTTKRGPSEALFQ